MKRIRIVANNWRRCAIIIFITMLIICSKGKTKNLKSLGDYKRQHRELIGPTDASQWTVSGNGIGGSVQF